MSNQKDESSLKQVPELSITKVPEYIKTDLKELYQSLNKNQLLHCHLMLRFL
jgi:hypothetical protein